MKNSASAFRAPPVLVAAMPAVFVLLWSTGFIGAKYGLPYAEPFTFLSLRFAAVAGVLALVGLLMRAPWPKSAKEIWQMCIIGVLLQGIYLGGVFASIHQGVGPGVSALIVGIQPLLVAVLSGPLLGEKITRRQWLGFLLGLAGVMLVVVRKLELGAGTTFGMSLSFLALLGMTAGTIYQKHAGGAMDLRTGNAIQFAAGALAMWVMALIFETRVVDWTPEFIGAMVWLCVVLSFGAITLLFIMIRQGEAARVSSLFFLVPASTAVISWIMFDETFGPVALAGMFLALFGVALVNFGGARN